MSVLSQVVQERKLLEVYVDPGMENGQKITFRGEADEEPGAEPGDVVVALRQEEHPVFKRKGNNLIMEKEVELVEALCGFHFVVNHLDQRQVVITSDGIIKPDDVKSVPEEGKLSRGQLESCVQSSEHVCLLHLLGMPTWKHPFEKGYLFVKFKINFPTTLQGAQISEIENALGPRPRVRIPTGENVETATMIDFNPGQTESRRGGYEAYEEDEDDGQRVQCAQQ